MVNGLKPSEKSVRQSRASEFIGQARSKWFIKRMFTQHAHQLIKLIDQFIFSRWEDNVWKIEQKETG